MTLRGWGVVLAGATLLALLLNLTMLHDPELWFAILLGAVVSTVAIAAPHRKG